VEALSGLLLFVIALGMLFGQWSFSQLEQNIGTKGTGCINYRFTFKLK